MSYRENWFWFSIRDSIIEHPIITREQNEGNYTYYLFNKFKIYTKKQSDTVKNDESNNSSFKISIIVPVYNTEKYLERCLNSIINQTLKEIEVICVNDGSTDNSLSILQKYASIDSRIVIINKQNEGVCAARNKALHIAQGEYIGYIDSDDSISDNFYELLYTNAKKFNADIACGEIVRPNAKKHKNMFKIKKLKAYTETEQKYKACNIPKFNYIVNKIYKKESLLKSKIEFEEGVVFEDLLWTHMVVDKLGLLITVPKAKYNYFVNQNSITETANINEKSMNDYYKAHLKCMEYLIKNRIKIRDYKMYKPQKRIRFNIFGIRFFDCLLWESVKVLLILGIPVLKIYVNNNVK